MFELSIFQVYANMTGKIIETSILEIGQIAGRAGDTKETAILEHLQKVLKK